MIGVFFYIYKGCNALNGQEMDSMALTHLGASGGLQTQVQAISEADFDLPDPPANLVKFDGLKWFVRVSHT